MDLSKLYRLHNLLRAGRVPVPLESLLAELRCSAPTFHRLQTFLKEELGAPLRYNRKRRGYEYAEGERFELPGLWLGARELAGLVGLEHAVRELQGGLLEEQLGPVRERLDALLAAQGIDPGGLRERVRILPMGQRAVRGAVLRAVLQGVLLRRRLRLEYDGGIGGESTRRMVCPQTLVHYRDNWYMDAWCHLRQALRTFALSRVLEVEVQADPARELPRENLQDYFAGSYGIFAGRARAVAEIEFSGNAARLVAQEVWHVRQQGRLLDDGRYTLSFPYGDSRELVMDILRYGEEAQVLGPPELRAEVAGRLRRAAARYAETGGAEGNGSDGAPMARGLEKEGRPGDEVQRRGR